MDEKKLFNIYINKKDILIDCQKSLLSDKEYDDKYSNFLITYNEILKMHLTIFLDIKNNKNNLTIIIDYLCILILLLSIPNIPENPENPEESEKLKIDEQIKIIKDTLNKIENDKKISNTSIIKLKDKITKNDEISKLIKTSSDYDSFISPLTSSGPGVTGGTVAPGTGSPTATDGTGIGIGAASSVAPDVSGAATTDGKGGPTDATDDTSVAATTDGKGDPTVATGTTSEDGHGNTTDVAATGNGTEGDHANIATDNVVDGHGNTADVAATGNGTEGDHANIATDNAVVVPAPVPNTTDGNDDNISQKLLEILKMKIMHDILLFNKNDFNEIKTQISAID